MNKLEKATTAILKLFLHNLGYESDLKSGHHTLGSAEMALTALFHIYKSGVPL